MKLKQNIMNHFRHCLVLFGVVCLVLASTGSAIAATKETYCSVPNVNGCLKPITVGFSSECVKNYGEDPKDGGLVHMKFFNQNPVDADRLITVYRNGEEVFEDAGFTEPGESVLTYGPFKNAKWEVVVHWEGEIFGQETFPFSCIPLSSR